MILTTAIRSSWLATPCAKVATNARGFSSTIYNEKYKGVTKTQPNPPLSSKFAYTMDTGSMTVEQRKFYDDNGFIMMRNLISKDKLAGFIDRFRKIANGEVKVPGMTVQKDIQFVDKERDENSVYKLQDLFLDEDNLFKYCTDKNILDIAENFTGPNIVTIHTMLINKPPDSGEKSSRHPLHQDLLYFPMRPVNMIVGVWTAMEKVTRENGCLVVIPGSHKRDLLPHEYPDWEKVNRAYYGIQGGADPRRVHVEMNLGDTIFFHPLLIHGSGMNRTKGYRKAISCHFASADVDFIDVKGTYQESLSQDIIDIAKKRYSSSDMEIDYSTIWKLRSRFVRGSNKQDWVSVM